MLTLILLSFGKSFFAQLDSINKYASLFQRDVSIISNAQQLNRFLDALKELEANKRKQVTVVHIGDSHVQAGYLTEPTRKGLQQIYGNAGRGLVFPYQAAGTNGPLDYAFSSAQKFLAKRNCVSKINLPTGVAGHAIHTRLKNTSLDFRFRDINSNELTSKVTVFHASTADSNFTYQVVDSLGKVIGRYQNEVSSPHRSVFELAENCRKFKLKTIQNEKNQISSTIFGVSLENNNAGIVHHTIGVNGAEFQHYLHSPFFFGQLASLKPDLIIVSLGTNEAYNNATFETNDFKAKVDSFLMATQLAIPQTSIILTTPPGIGQKVRKGKKSKPVYIQNQNVVKVVEAIQAQALKNNVSVWDFYEVMGGLNAMNRWAASGLTDARRIHFSRKGYFIQGTLLFEALINEIEHSKN